MTPDALADAGRSLFGTGQGWQADLARALGMSDRHLRRLLAGSAPITPSIAVDVTALLARQAADRALAQAEELLRRHGQPVEVALSSRDPVGRAALDLIRPTLEARGFTVTLA